MSFMKLMKSSVPSLLNFYQEWTLYFVKCFFWTIKVIISFHLVLSSVCEYDLYVNTEWLLNVKPTVFLGFSPNWPWYVILLIQFWIWFAKFFRKLYVYIHKAYWPEILLLFYLWKIYFIVSKNKTIKRVVKLSLYHTFLKVCTELQFYLFKIFSRNLG